MQVLATGLSGLYSSLPRKLNIVADDWYRLQNDDIETMPDLVHFLNSLEFCNAVVQVRIFRAIPSLIPKDKLFEFESHAFSVFRSLENVIKNTD